MPVMQSTPTRTRVCVIDDNTDTRSSLCSLANQADMSPILIESAASLTALVDRICQSADFAITDLRLSEAWPVSYNGAQLASALYKRRIPTVVVSDFAHLDANTDLRKHRRFLPEVRMAEDFHTVQDVTSSYTTCALELSGIMPRHRRAWNSLLRVVTQTIVSNEELVEVEIPEWAGEETIRFPRSMLPDSLRAKDLEGERLFAMVNTDARTADELYFYEFTLAPRPR